MKSNSLLWLYHCEVLFGCAFAEIRIICPVIMLSRFWSTSPTVRVPQAASVKSVTTNLYPSNITFANILFFWVAPTCRLKQQHSYFILCLLPYQCISALTIARLLM